MKIRIIGFLIVVAVLVGLLLASQHRQTPPMVSGFIEADEIRLGSRVGGRVAAVHVAEGSQVRQGDTLVELEPFDLREREAQTRAAWEQARLEHEKLSRGYRDEEKQQAAARVRQLEARLEKLRNGPRPQEIAAARAEAELATASLDLARASHRRIQELYETQAAAREQYDRAVRELRASEATLTTREEQLNLLEAGTRAEDIAEAEAQLEESRQARDLMLNGYRSEEIAQAYEAMREADAAHRASEAQLAELKITAPLDGTVEAIELQPGDLVGPNAPVMSLLDRSSLWVRAYVPEDALDIKVGQRVRVTVDSYPDENFAGEVVFIARQAEFTPQNVQTPEERSKQVFRIKVMLRDDDGKLRPGMAADVWLDG